MTKSLFDKVTERLLSLVGLGPDFTVDLRESSFSQITENLYLGARPNRERVEDLKKAGVTHVVSCLMESERPRIEYLQQDFQHLFLGVHDGIQQNLEEKFSPFFDFATVAIASGPKSKLLVHCEVGVSRSPSLVIALLMKTEDLSFFDAFRRVQSKRYKILPNIGFASQLQRLEHELHPQSKNSELSSLARYLHGICNAPVEIEVLQSALERNHYDALTSLRMIFGDDIPRVIQGVRL
jgi:protein-tyrosine phosphatase